MLRFDMVISFAQPSVSG